MVSFRSTRSRRWPFWALLLAWVCANGPQSAFYEAMVWVKAGSTFSHQARLTRSVAALLSGREAPLEPARATALKSQPVPSASIAPEAVLKKVDLGLPLHVEFPLQPANSQRIPPTDCSPPARIPGKVLLTPPRAA